MLPSTRSWGAREFIPNVDIKDTDGELKVNVELPGMTENDVNVELEEDMLTISGEKKEEEEREEEGSTWRESSYGRFVRQIPLMTKIDTEKTEANMKNGCLTITMPKLSDEKTHRRKIEVHHQEG